MTTYQRWTEKRILILVRTYPVPARKGVEVSCTAGITDDGKWIRVFPVPWRFLDYDKRFRKYWYIEAKVKKSQSDVRPESHEIDISSIEILPQFISSDNKWEARKAILSPFKSRSLCYLQSERDLHQEPTLGFFKPRVINRFTIKRTNSKWTDEEIARLKQYSLFGNAPQSQLEKIPYDFFYEFKCDDPNCHGHSLSCTDWEMGALYRKCVRSYGLNWEQKFRDTFETEMILGRDTHFFVGTIRTHPSEWIIIGLFYPPKLSS